MLRPCLEDLEGNLIEPIVEWPICLDYCTMLWDGCYDLFNDAGILDWLTPCDNRTNNGTLLFQGGASYVMPCLNYSSWNISDLSFTSCPETTIWVDGHCAHPCPSLVYSQSHYESFSLMFQIVGWMSFCTAPVLILLYLFHPKYRLFPNLILIYLSISTIP